jgi:hypothetical protein
MGIFSAIGAISSSALSSVCSTIGGNENDDAEKFISKIESDIKKAKNQDKGKNTQSIFSKETKDELEKIKNKYMSEIKGGQKNGNF